MERFIELGTLLLVKPQVFVFRIPPPGPRGHRATDWDINNWIYNGRLRIFEYKSELNIRIEDKNTGELFAGSIVSSYPSKSIENVIDSSRYFVIKITHDDGRSAFLGIGFCDRSDAFDFILVFQDYFRTQENEQRIRNSALAESTNGGQRSVQRVDYSLKEGQNMVINFGKKTGTVNSSTKVSSDKELTVEDVRSFLPPPPSGRENRRRGDADNQAMNRSQNNNTNSSQPSNNGTGYSLLDELLQF